MRADRVAGSREHDSPLPWHSGLGYSRSPPCCIEGVTLQHDLDCVLVTITHYSAANCIWVSIFRLACDVAGALQIVITEIVFSRNNLN